LKEGVMIAALQSGEIRQQVEAAVQVCEQFETFAA